MAAGLGFKTFTTGEVLTAADTNGYLMQGVLVFASSAARAAAITSPQEGQYSYLKDTNSTEYYDGAAWIAAPIGDITGVTAGTGISGGGTSGTVTITNSMATEITAAGDIIVGTGSGTFDNLPIGTTAQVLTADTTVSPYKVKWATPASGSSNPAFSVTTTSVQNFSSTTWTKVAFTSETFDTNNSFDSTTNYRFTPATAGIYSMSWIIEMAAGSSSYFYVAIYKNGNNWQTPTKQGSFTDFLQSGASLITMNGSTDYLEMYVYVSGSSPSLPIGTQAFAGAWIRSN
jgi:hypothetical protein